jgi:hypothetical protein
MKNSEDAIEKVLAGLRSPDAPIGMERRILEALQDQASARSRSGWRRLRPIWLAMPARPVAGRPLAWGVALAGVFAVAIAIPAIHRLGRGSGRQSARSLAQLPARSPSRSPSRSEMNQVSERSAAGLSPEGVAKSTPYALSRPGLRTAKQANVRRATDVQGSESVAVEEMLAASHPAPPMPLTEQERLLLRIAHRGDPVELAMLDPMRRAARDVEEQTEFQRFFKPRTIEQPTADQPTTEQPAVGQPATPQSTTEQLTPAQPTTEAAKPGDNE